MRVLVVTSEPVGAEQLRRAIGTDQAEDAEVMVVAPALHSSPLRFWMSDADEAIARAEAVATESERRLREADVDVATDTGEGDPVDAAADALATFPADLVILRTHGGDRQRYREDDIDPGELERRLGVPVRHELITQS